jgi:tetratricopeptide (TPR) repeat protein
VKKVMAAMLLLAGLSLAAILANQAVQRDLEYRRLIAHGDAALSQGQTFVAIEAFSGAIALKPASMLAYLKRGEAHLHGGDAPDTLSAALRDLRTAAQIDPGATRALEALGDVNLKLRRYTNAADSYESYLRLDDHSAVVFYKLALACRGDGRLSQALSALHAALKLNPSFGEAHYVLGLSHKDRDELKQARAAFEQAVRVAPAMIPAREELADIDRIQGQTREEIDQLEALAALDPHNAERLIAVGLAYLRAGNREQAVTTLGRAADRFQDHTGVYAALGEVWLLAAEDRGDRADARKALEALQPIATQPSASSTVLGLYGRALTIAGDPDRAEQVFRQAVQRFPVDPDMLPPYATLAQSLGHFEDARQALIRYSVLVDEDSDEAAHAADIGDLSLDLNDAATAIKWYEKSEMLAPADATLLVRLAEAQFKTGRTHDSEVTLARAVAMDPTNAAAIALGRKLSTASTAAASHAR